MHRSLAVLTWAIVLEQDSDASKTQLPISQHPAGNKAEQARFPQPCM
jgi:hypothetical protein